MQNSYQEHEEISDRIKAGVVALLKAAGEAKESSIMENASLDLIEEGYTFHKYMVYLLPEDAVYIKNNPESQEILKEHIVTVSNGNLKDQNGGLITISSKEIDFGVKI